MAEQHVFGVECLYGKPSLEEQRDLSLKIKECKEGYLVELEFLKGKTHWDSKRKRHVQDLPKQAYLSKAVQNFLFKLKRAKRCFEKLKNGHFEDGVATK